jgi:Flp pilus assembly protein TadG
MQARNTQGRRRGALLPLLGLCLFFLLALVALAIDVGMLAVARCQCQNAADSAAMAGARTINGNETGNYNLSQVPTNAIAAAKANYVLAKPINDDPDGKGLYPVVIVNPYTYEAGQVKVEIGAYAYTYDDGNPSKEGFGIEIPRQDTNEPYSTVRATVTATGDYAFARVLGLTQFNVIATSTAAHRPRDVIIIMDLSGSMRYQSLPGMFLSGGVVTPSATNRPRNVSMNPETVFPQFGHYSDTVAAALKGTTAYSTGSEQCDPANISTTSDSGPPIAEDFFQNTFGVAPSAGNRAFARSSDTYDKTPGGDNYLRTANNTVGNPYAKTVTEITGGDVTKEAAFEANGYNAYVGDFKGYTEGPGYWGKTFFIWPPDPRGSVLDANDPANHANNGAKDWRQRFFFKYNTATAKLGWLNHNNLLFDSAGQPATAGNQTPGNTVIRHPNTAALTIKEDGVNFTYQYKINYAAILHWLKENPVHFPTQLRAGRIKYYDPIPDPSDTALNNRWWTTHPLTDVNERFWKEYIDFVLGLQAIGANSYTKRNVDPDGVALSNVPISALIGNGDYYPWGTMKVSVKPDPVVNKGNINNAVGYVVGTKTMTVKNFATAPLAGQYVKFDLDPTYYKISSATTTSITLSTGILVPVLNGDIVRVFATSTPVFKYMDYADNPHRPRHQFWFGPMTFVDYLGNYNTSRFWWPGNVHEAQSWACKVGIQTAIDDIKKNHPSDFIGMAFFSSPKYSASGGGQHNKAIVPLGRSYQLLKDSLWFPPTTVVGTAKEITPYDDDFDNVPRAKGSTSPGMGFLIAYNLLSSNISNLRSYSQPQPLYRGSAGGLGRKGATRLVIFETDGAPNARSYAALSGSGSSAYYPIRIKYPEKLKDSGNVEWPASGTYAASEVYSVVEQICKLESLSGYSTARKKVQVYALGYGALFDPSGTSTAQTTALDFLQTVQFKGNTATSTSGANFPDWQRIYGNNDQRIDRMKNAFTTIMQAGVQVSLLE